MSTRTPQIPLSGKSPAERMFPKLTPTQLARVVAHGHRRSARRGEVLFEAGDPAASFFVVIAGQVEIVRPSGTGEELVAVHGPGQFTGEVNMLTGRRPCCGRR